MEYVLKIKSNFTDKYTDKKYHIGETVTFDEARAIELMSDPRRLVALVIEEPVVIEEEAVLTDEEVLALKADDVLDVEIKKAAKPRKTKKSKPLV